MMSRIQVLDTPIMSPGVCTICGSDGGDGRKFIDYGHQLDWYGAVYFCSFCIKECATAVKFIPVESFDQLHTDFRELQVKHDKLLKENEALRNAISTLLDGSNTVVSSDLSSSDSSVDSVSSTELADKSNEDDVLGDPEIDELVSLKGLDDLFESSDFDDKSED
jgi:hypothetical protein